MDNRHEGKYIESVSLGSLEARSKLFAHQFRQNVLLRTHSLEWIISFLFSAIHLNGTVSFVLVHMNQYLRTALHCNYPADGLQGIENAQHCIIKLLLKASASHS